MRTPIFWITVSLMLLLPAFAWPKASLILAGQVSMEGTPQIRVQAWIRLLQLGTVLEQKPTVRSGQFEFSVNAAGGYTLEVEAPGFVPAKIDVSIGAGNEPVYLFIDLTRVRPTGTELSKIVSIAEYLIPKNARLEFERARNQQKQSKCSRALVHFENALKIYSDYAAAHNEMGNCFVRLGMLDRAEESFKNAVKLATTVYPSMNLADIYVEQKRYDDARSVLRAAIRSNPSEGDAYYALALVYFQEGLIDEAESIALEADARKHEIADLHLLLAKIHSRKNDVRSMVKQLEFFLKEERSGPRADEIRQQVKRMRKN